LSGCASAGIERAASNARETGKGERAIRAKADFFRESVDRR
jgi:hypothetical protein